MTVANRIETYWNKRSQDFNEVRLHELKSRNAAAWQELILQQLPSGRQLNILDIGTGTGFFALLLDKAGHKTTGIDSSAQMIAHARANACHFQAAADFHKMNAEILEFEAESFDVVISRNLTWTLPHVKKAYAEWRRVLRPEGILLNFDSDYGHTSFAGSKQQPACVHNGIDTELLDECTSIKDQLLVSSRVRPIWDQQLLRSVGFRHITIEADVTPQVHIDEQLQYEDVPVFGLYAQK